MVPARRILLAVAAVVIAAVSSSAAVAQLATDRAVTIVVPFTPGTGQDILARIIGEELQKRWTQTFIIENKPGATGNLGAQFVSRATSLAAATNNRDGPVPVTQ